MEIKIKVHPVLYGCPNHNVTGAFLLELFFYGLYELYKAETYVGL